jgi:hypothetical protein
MSSRWKPECRTSRRGGAGVLAAAIAAMAVLAIAPQASAHHLPAVWIGAPAAGHWPSASGCVAGRVWSGCSLPSGHWTPVRGDWAVDLRIPGNQSVYLYAAPQNTSLSISARIESVTATCAGQTVKVALYNGATKVGWVSYTHIRAAVTAGRWVSRWGTKLGTVGTGYAPNSSCWTGPHVHLEMYSQHAYACYNKGWRPGQAFKSTNFLGFIGGNYASGPRRACP